MLYQFIYKLALLAHVIGLSMMAGTTLCQFILFKKLRKANSSHFQQQLHSLFQLGKLVFVGLIVQVISGIWLLIATNWVYESQLWFQIKISIVIFVSIYGGVFQRRFETKLIQETNPAKLKKLNYWINNQFLFQLFFFAVIFLLAIFKFN